MIGLASDCLCDTHSASTLHLLEDAASAAVACSCPFAADSVAVNWMKMMLRSRMKEKALLAMLLVVVVVVVAAVLSCH